VIFNSIKTVKMILQHFRMTNPSKLAVVKSVKTTNILLLSY